MTDLSPQEREARSRAKRGRDMNQAGWIDHGWKAAKAFYEQAAEADANRLAGERDRLAGRVAELQRAVDQAAKVMRESEYVGGPSEREAWKVATLALSRVESQPKAMTTR